LEGKLRVPYTQQFAPEQTPLRRLLSDNPPKLGGLFRAEKKAVAAAFFKDLKTPREGGGKHADLAQGAWHPRSKNAR